MLEILGLTAGRGLHLARPGELAEVLQMAAAPPAQREPSSLPLRPVGLFGNLVAFPQACLHPVTLHRPPPLRRSTVTGTATSAPSAVRSFAADACPRPGVLVNGAGRFRMSGYATQFRLGGRLRVPR